MKTLISIYKSDKADEMYLYVARVAGLSKVPEALLSQFGKPVHVTDMILTPDRKLSRAEATRVLEQIDTAGFYLQMPPKKEDYQLSLFKDTSDRYKGMS